MWRSVWSRWRPRRWTGWTWCWWTTVPRRGRRVRRGGGSPSGTRGSGWCTTRAAGVAGRATPVPGTPIRTPAIWRSSTRTTCCCRVRTRICAGCWTRRGRIWRPATSTGWGRRAAVSRRSIRRSARRCCAPTSPGTRRCWATGSCGTRCSGGRSGTDTDSLSRKGSCARTRRCRCRRTSWPRRWTCCTSTSATGGCRRARSGTGGRRRRGCGTGSRRCPGSAASWVIRPVRSGSATDPPTTGRS